MSKPDFNQIINESFVTGKSTAELLKEMYFKGAEDFFEWFFYKNNIPFPRTLIELKVAEWKKE